MSAALLAKDIDNLAVEWVLADPGQAAEITGVENNLADPPIPIDLSGTTADATPLIKGELLQNLAPEQRVHVYSGESWLGAAVATGTKWTFQSPELGVGNHALQAAIVSADGSVLSRGSVWPLVVHGAASQAQGQSAVVALSLAANFARTPVTQTALSSAPTGSNHLQCFQAGSDDLVACDSPQAIALSGVNKQDGMRLQSGAHRFARVGNQPLSSCVHRCTGKPLLFTHEQALKHAATVEGWRLPTRRELFGLVDTQCSSPAIDTAAFPDTPAQLLYWTSTPALPELGKLATTLAKPGSRRGQFHSERAQWGASTVPATPVALRPDWSVRRPVAWG